MKEAKEEVSAKKSDKSVEFFCKKSTSHSLNRFKVHYTFGQKKTKKILIRREREKEEKEGRKKRRQDDKQLKAIR
jgi:hypothetical protein